MAFRVIQPAEEDGGKMRVVTPARQAQRRRNRGDEVMGYLSVFNKNVPFLDEANDALAAGADTVGGLLTGDVPPSQMAVVNRGIENFRRRRALSQHRSADFEGRHPVAAANAKGVGISAQILPALLTGGGSAATTVSAAAPRGLMGASARLLKPMADSAVVAGLGAQAAAYGGDGSLAERAETARTTTIPAMAVGAAIPPGLALASKARRVAADVMGGAGRSAARAANRVAGGRLLDPNQEAMKRLGEALKNDGLGPQEVRAALAEWQRAGASSPALMDLAGENTRALLRAAAGKSGAARNAAVRYADEVTGDLQGNVINRTRALTADRRPASEVAEGIATARRKAADEMYPAFADERVPVTDEVRSAADGAAEWMRGAMQLARAERRPEVVAELEALSAGGGSLDDVSAGTLDYVRRALRDASGEAFSGGKGGLGAALKDRAQDLEASLMGVPGFDEARKTYRGFSQQLDAIDAGKKVLNEVPDDFGATFAELPVEQGAIGARQALEEAVGRPAEGATGTLNRIATSTNTGRNLETVFGPEEAARYRDAVGREIERVGNARFISPNNGSQTQPRDVDQALIDLPTTKVGWAKALFDKLRSGVTLTPAEREAVIELGTTIVRSGEDIPALPTTPQAMRLLTPAQRARLAKILAAGEGEMAAQSAQPAY